MEWLSMVVGFVAAYIFGVLARRSPKRNWEFIIGWPAVILMILNGAFSQVEFAQKQVERNLPRCEWNFNEARAECEPTVNQRNPIEDLKADLLERVKSGAISIFLDGFVEIFGATLGMGSLKQAYHALQKE